MPSQARIEANRKNAQKSTGPRTPEGKSKVRFNALKDGATAKSPVIPGEDPAEFQARIDTWTQDLAPTNSAERYLVEHAARASWQLDRLDRAHAARLAYNIRNAASSASHNLNQQVASLGRRLFHDPRGPIQTYPHFEYKPHLIPGQPRISWNGLADDPNHPAALLHQLESTEPGCHWLLARWSELRRQLDHNIPWQSPDKLKAIRLLGHQPLEALDHPEIATLFLASHALDPTSTDPFRELWRELSAGEKLIFQPRLDARGLQPFDPTETQAARDWLQNLITCNTRRLERLAADHQDRQQADADDESDRLAFDNSPGGERLRRFHATCSRSMIRSLDLLRKTRQSPPAPEPDPVPEPPPQLPEPHAKPEPAEPESPTCAPAEAARPLQKNKATPSQKPPSQSPAPQWTQAQCTGVKRHPLTKTASQLPSPQREVPAAPAMSPVKLDTPLARDNRIPVPASSVSVLSVLSVVQSYLHFFKPRQSTQYSATSHTRIPPPSSWSPASLSSKPKQLRAPIS
jgi:hypothetical protein